MVSSIMGYIVRFLGVRLVYCLVTIFRRRRSYIKLMFLLFGLESDVILVWRFVFFVFDKVDEGVYIGRGVSEY